MGNVASPSRFYVLNRTVLNVQHTIVKRGRDVKLIDISLILYFHRRSFPGMCCPTDSCSYASKSRTAPKSFSTKCLIEIGNGSSLQAILIACKYGEWRIMKYIRRRSHTSFYCSALTLALEGSHSYGKTPCVLFYTNFLYIF